MKPFSLSIHIFRRDLRLEDNTALLESLRQSKEVMPLFIFDDRQLNNPFKGNNSFQFMINSLVELNEEIQKYGSKLHVLKGHPTRVLEEIYKQVSFDAVFINRDYTPFSLKRDEEIETFCQKQGVKLHRFADALLTEPEMVHKDDGKPYTVFTPFKRKAKHIAINHPIKHDRQNYYRHKIHFNSSLDDPSQLLEEVNPHLLLKGGRREGLAKLNNMTALSEYHIQRDIPAVSATSLLSAHHKFGTISIRETYHRIKSIFSEEHTLISELYWRDFFTHIGFHFPKVFDGAFRLKYNHIPWENKQTNFDAWCKGKTGFPLVDAGMRELITTGYMHNRVRMVVASFLVKDLHIDWRWGERFFANHLVDYDPAVNNGNWQWAASTGCDAQPYFRVFNPWNQQKKFDSECTYIKQWIPELRAYSAKQIHKLTETAVEGYPAPIIDHRTQAEEIKRLFKQYS